LIHYASELGRCEMVELLIAKGADVNAVDLVGALHHVYLAACGPGSCLESHMHLVGALGLVGALHHVDLVRDKRDMMN
jgi:ankyrin repeat protein